MTIYSVAHVPG